jgi:hypothetical protein
MTVRKLRKKVRFPTTQLQHHHHCHHHYYQRHHHHPQRITFVLHPSREKNIWSSILQGFTRLVLELVGSRNFDNSNRQSCHLLLFLQCEFLFTTKTRLFLFYFYHSRFTQCLRLTAISEIFTHEKK